MGYKSSGQLKLWRFKVSRTSPFEEEDENVF